MASHPAPIQCRLRRPEPLRELERTSSRGLLLADSLAEVLARSGKKLAVVSSSGNGCAYLLNHRAREGVGLLINGLLEPGKLVAQPDTLNEVVLRRFWDVTHS